MYPSLNLGIDCFPEINRFCYEVLDILYLKKYRRYCLMLMGTKRYIEFTLGCNLLLIYLAMPKSDSKKRLKRINHSVEEV